MRIPVAKPVSAVYFGVADVKKLAAAQQKVAEYLKQDGFFLSPSLEENSVNVTNVPMLNKVMVWVMNEHTQTAVRQALGRIPVVKPTRKPNGFTLEGIKIGIHLIDRTAAF